MQLIALIWIKKGYKYEFMETPGGHVWTCWRIYLSVFAPKLFK